MASSDLYEAGSAEEEEEQPVRPTDLSELLKAGTKESHDKAQNTEFLKEFLKGRIKRELFKRATAALYHTYSALEEELERHREHPAIAVLYFPEELSRTAALKEDLRYLYGADWEDAIRCSEATRAYVAQIRQLGEEHPELLVAHAYTRYMGDLSGGQVLRKVAQRALHLPDTGEGTRFYAFQNVTNAHKFKQLYRARLNTLELEPHTKSTIVQEAKRVFHYNMQVFEELEKLGALLPDEDQADGAALHDGKGDIRKCPYYAAKSAAAGVSACPYHAVLTIASRPEAKAVLTALAAALAAALAWYLME